MIKAAFVLISFLVLLLIKLFLNLLYFPHLLKKLLIGFADAGDFLTSLILLGLFGSVFFLHFIFFSFLFNEFILKGDVLVIIVIIVGLGVKLRFESKINGILRSHYDLLRAPFSMDNVYIDSLPRIFRSAFITKIVLVRCRLYSIPRVVLNIPSTVISEPLVKIALERCNSDKIPELFSNIPIELLSEQSVRFALERCDSDKVPGLFSNIPNKLLSEQLVKFALEKCRPRTIRTIPKLFSNIPNELLSEQLVKFALEKCYPGEIPELFSNIPNELLSEQLVKFALERCGLWIPELFSNIPNELLSEQLVRFALERCDSDKVPELVSEIPNGLLSEQLLKMALEKCDIALKLCRWGHEIPELFSKIPNELLSEQLVKRALERCDSGKIPELFSKIPNELLSEQSVKFALERCASDKILELFSNIPNEMKTETVSQVAVEKCRSDIFDLLSGIREKTENILNSAIPSLAGYLLDSTPKSDTKIAPCSYTYEECVKESKGYWEEVLLEGSYSDTYYKRTVWIETPAEYKTVTAFRDEVVHIYSNQDYKQAMDKLDQLVRELGLGSAHKNKIIENLEKKGVYDLAQGLKKLLHE